MFIFSVLIIHLHVIFLFQKYLLGHILFIIELQIPSFPSFPPSLPLFPELVSRTE